MSFSSNFRKLARFSILSSGFILVGNVFAIGTGNVNAIWPLPKDYTSINPAGFCVQNSFGLHIGIDIGIPEGKPVYSVCDGTVKLNNTSKNYPTLNSKYWNSFLILEHTCGGSKSYGYYGHLTSSLSSGASVKAGQVIGYIRASYNSNDKRTVSNDHLHFGTSSKYLTSGWGYDSSCNSAKSKGWKDPLTYFLFSNSIVTPALKTPSILSISMNGMTANIKWSPISGATTYRVVVSQYSDFRDFKDDAGNSTCGATCYTTTTSGTSYSHTASLPSHTYYVKVRAGSNTAPASAWSAVQTFKTPVQVASLALSCSSSVNESSSSAGTCVAKAYYSDGSSKTVSPSWSDNSSALSVSTSGKISTGSVSTNTAVTIMGTYIENGKTVQGSAKVTVKDIPIVTPKILSVSPLTVTYGRSTTFTVKGTGLPTRLATWIGECVGTTSPTLYTSGNVTTHTFTCTPRYTKGVKSGVIKDAANGKTLYSFKVTVK